jgi:hypothetical protein
MNYKQRTNSKGGMLSNKYCFGIPPKAGKNVILMK